MRQVPPLPEASSAFACGWGFAFAFACITCEFGFGFVCVVCGFFVCLSNAAAVDCPAQQPDPMTRLINNRVYIDSALWIKTDRVSGRSGNREHPSAPETDWVKSNPSNVVWSRLVLFLLQVGDLVVCFCQGRSELIETVDLF